MSRLAMVYDLDRCIGCWACAVACKVENSVGENLWWQKVATIGGESIDTSAGVYPDLHKQYRPRNCAHCADPPCIPACPTNAIIKRSDGIVQILSHACIGCGDCQPACPYDAIELNIDEPQLPIGLEKGHGAAEVAPRVAGMVEKCTFCSHRVDQGLEPACVVACPTKVILFGDLEDEASEVASAIGRASAFREKVDSGADPSIWYLAPTTCAEQRRSGTRAEPR